MELFRVGADAAVTGDAFDEAATGSAVAPRKLFDAFADFLADQSLAALQCALAALSRPLLLRLRYSVESRKDLRKQYREKAEVQRKRAASRAARD